jgi:putative ABC transport system ATP-binding protein
MTRPLLSAHEVSKTYGQTRALRGVSLAVEPGETVAITGPSGSGKSTLLMSLAGVIPVDGGWVEYDGRSLGDLSESERSILRRRQFGFVFQFGGLVPELAAVENVAVPLLLDGRRRSEAESEARAWLERLEVADVAEALPADMSGGQAQRVAVARALVSSPRVLFADEPTGALDTVAGEHVLKAMRGAAEETGASIVLVTHDNRVAAAAGREVLLRDGLISNGARQ